MARTFSYAPDDGGDEPLLVGIMGPPGGGKTFSALRLATGICRVRGGKPCVIDTEKRSGKYKSSFSFDRIVFEPPFVPEDFLSAIRKTVSDGAGAIIVDSMSDEHEGEGGVLDWHDKELDRMAGDDWAKRERCTQAAWIKPKASRRALINGLLQIKTPMIFCFRAREKTKQIANERGRAVPTNIGYQPIAPLEIVHQLDLNCLLPPRADGVPVWRSDKSGEDFIIKLPNFLAQFIQEGAPLSEDMGEAFGRWARGGAAPVARRSPLADEGDMAAERGTAALQAFWMRLTPAEKREAGGAAKLDEWKRAAERADQETGADEAGNLGEVAA